jgi:hypothetical protein
MCVTVNGVECEYEQSVLSQNSVCLHCIDCHLFTPKTPVKIKKFPPRPVGEINQQVIKVSGKPFKSGNTVNTIKGYMEHPQIPNEKAYTFYEDDSYVEVRRCLILSTAKTLSFNVEDKDLAYLKNMMKEIDDLKQLVSKQIMKLCELGSFQERFDNWLEFAIKEDLPWLQSAGEKVRYLLVEERDYNRCETIDITTIMDWIYDDESYCTWDEEGKVSTFTQKGIDIASDLMEYNLGSITIDW